MTPRSARALRQPPDDLSSFPATGIKGAWFREHALRPDAFGGGCWHFTGYEVGNEPRGRFDLPEPHGTCYLAQDEATAARERCGRFLAARLPVPSGFVEGRVVSTAFPRVAAGRAAGATHADATKLGVTRELSTVDDYAVTARWAQALFDAGFEALVYEPRFSTGSAKACAVFGESGIDQSRVVHRRRPLADVLEEMGVVVVDPPGASVRADDEAPLLDERGRRTSVGSV